LFRTYHDDSTKISIFWGTPLVVGGVGNGATLWVACGTSFVFSIVMYYLIEPPLKKLRNIVRGQKL
jgi:peptidoglycan/LPS O-acetylase OafA/YrhL